VESGLAGIPIIISRFNALPEYFKHEKSALFVSPHSVEELKYAILRLIEDDSLAQTLSEGIMKVTIPFKVEEVINRSLELLKKYNWEL
jgi:glycosyltransferase involved in cell wall biosynthesis